MKQPHTEDALDHTDGQQDTGNHPAPGTPAHAPGGQRQGAENVEPAAGAHEAPKADKAAGLEENLDDALSVNGPAERD